MKFYRAGLSPTRGTSAALRHSSSTFDRSNIHRDKMSKEKEMENNLVMISCSVLRSAWHVNSSGDIVGGIDDTSRAVGRIAREHGGLERKARIGDSAGERHRRLRKGGKREGVAIAISSIVVENGHKGKGNRVRDADTARIAAHSAGRKRRHIYDGLVVDYLQIEIDRERRVAPIPGARFDAVSINGR